MKVPQAARDNIYNSVFETSGVNFKLHFLEIDIILKIFYF